MGLINNNMFETYNGIQKVGTYISFNNEMLFLRKNGQNQYIITASYQVYWDKAARDSGKSFIDKGLVSEEVSDTNLDSSMYTILYTKLKSIFTNTIDDL